MEDLIATDRKPEYDVIIVGGGLAGLVCATELAKAQRRVLLLEKRTYPYHKVCGEYVSNEVLPYLQSLGFDPFRYGASAISRLRISTPSGKSIRTTLDLGAFGLSRHTMDLQLAELARRQGAALLTGTKVNDIRFNGRYFEVATARETYAGRLVIGSWGKREALDKKLGRHFMEKRTGYMAVKYHIRTDYPADEIGLDNFKDGYCGIVKVEGDRYNLCFLHQRAPDQEKPRHITDYESMVRNGNPVLKRIFANAEFLLDAPVVINEICFSPKPLIEDHILMCGDTAGLITPLCGNGMSMAIGAAKLLSGLIAATGILAGKDISLQQRAQLEQAYREAWDRQFRRRLFWGRTIQRFFGNPTLTEAFVRGIHAIPPLERRLIAATHGKPLL